jgi:hypothetical protein
LRARARACVCVCVCVPRGFEKRKIFPRWHKMRFSFFAPARSRLPAQGLRSRPRARGPWGCFASRTRRVSLARGAASLAEPVVSPSPVGPLR